jgi:diguanylate cyclase (GGDEF)-like protein/PAS domain S-box-containing protein
VKIRRLHVALPEDTLERVRTVYFALTIAVSVPYALQLLLSGAPNTTRAAGLATLLALTTYRAIGFRRTRFPLLGDPLESAALVVLGWAIGDITKALPVLFLALNFRAFYGSMRRSLGLTAMYALAVIAGAVVAPAGQSPFAIVFPLIPTVWLNGAFTAYLKRTLVGKTVLERSLRVSEARFRTLVQNSADVILVVGDDGVIRFNTPSASRLLGAPDAGLVGRDLAAIVHPDEVDRVFAIIRDERSVPGTSLELRLLHADGAMWLHVEALIGGRIEGDLAGTVLTLRDVTQRKALEQRLRHEAVHDALTQLPNRAELLRSLEAALEGSAVGGTTVGVLFVDLDDFKTVNDTMGHGAGDQLLVAAARRFRNCVHGDDVVARMGGDEFALLLQRLRTADDAHIVARRVLGALQAPFAIAGRDVFVRASIGIATTDGSSPATATDLLRHADTAMYAAKGNGKGRVESFEPSMGAAIERRAGIEADLRSAIAEGQLFLEYQPIVRLDGQVTGAEGLVRWRHPTRGVVPPLEFIDLAEHAGLAVPLGRFVTERAIRDLAEWRSESAGARAGFRLSVNLSASQLLDREYPAFLASLLSEYQVPSHAIAVEITETVLMQDAPAIGERLAELKRLGIGLALDDFGTGYTSLAYLHQFPIDVLKIDRTFVRDLGIEPKKTALTQSIIGLCASLGFDAVPEGIETQTQRDMLRSYGAEYGQGYLFGRPVSATTFFKSHLSSSAPLIAA